MSRSRLDELASDSALPEIVRQLAASGELEEIRLDRRGHWWHRGSRFENPRIAQLFSRSVARTEGGTWVLRIGRFTYPIVVEDLPLFVERIEVVADSITAEISDGSRQVIDPASVRYAGGGGMSCAVAGNSGMRARFLSAPLHALADYVEEDDEGFALVLGRTRHLILPE